MEVESFDQARAFLAALGYQVDMVYEKYRTKYELEGVHLDLDEMPYGDFIELEGNDVPRSRIPSATAWAWIGKPARQPAT